MKRSKLGPKLVLVTLVAILALSLAIAPVQGWGWGGSSNVKYRSINDWMENNPWGGAPGWAGYDRDGSINFIFFDYVFNYRYYGCVREELMPDGTLEYEVFFLAIDVYMEVYNGFQDDEGNWWQDDLLLIGTIPYGFWIDFILEPIIPGGDTVWGYIEPGERGPGDMLPFIFMMLVFPDVIGGRITWLEIKGVGNGDLMEPDWYPGDPGPPVPTGETAQVFLHQEAFIAEDGTQTWPYENQFVS